MRLFWSPREHENSAVLVRALLRRAVFEMYGISLPNIEKTALGKPFFPTRPDIHFSLSHAKTCVLCAVGASPVGADVETVRPLRSGVAEKLCSPEELEDFGFFELWVMRESYYKLFGGSGINFRDIRFRRVNEGILAPDKNVYVRLFDTAACCTAAVCSIGLIPEDIEVTAVKNLL